MGFTKYSEGYVKDVLDSDEKAAATRRTVRLAGGHCPECGRPLAVDAEKGGRLFCLECDIPAPPESETN